MISKELQKKLDLYEQLYFSLDKPIPFKGGLILYPVAVSDYYNFYSSYSCLTMDKTVKYTFDEVGRPKKIPNPKGIAQSYCTYLIECMKDETNGQRVTAEVMQLFELIFHIKKSMYCPNCKKEILYSDLIQDMDEKIQKEKDDIITLLKNTFLEQFQGIDEEFSIPNELMEQIDKRAYINFLSSIQICPDCQSQMRDIFSIKKTPVGDNFVIRDVELQPNDFDELKALVLRQNILDYDGDKYMDPDLKEELEIKARLQNSDYTSPTLEKQLVCVVAETGLSFEYLQTITMRKLSMLLRTIDKKNTYYAQLQASLSGFVKFKEDPKHWIFSDDKKNIKDEITSLESFEKKFERVT